MIARLLQAGRPWLLMSLMFAAIALAWPIRPVTVAPGAAAILVFDITQSMNVVDMRINDEPVARIAFAKASAMAAVDGLPCGTAIGIGILAAHRALLLVAPVEVCQHRVELTQAIGFVDPAMAWQGNSEVAKAYYAALQIAAAQPNRPALVLLSDGHEAPPLNPLHRPSWDPPDRPAPALIAGLGRLVPSPIPKTAPDGRSLGYWGADDVLQIDTYTAGRGGSSAGEKMVETEAGKPVDARAVGTPGSEHLSALREPYLQLLADETGAHYARLDRVDDLQEALEQVLVMPGIASLAAVRIAASLALAMLCAFYAQRWLGRSA